MSENCEVPKEFLGREIRWAIAAKAAEKVPLSIHTLRKRVASKGTPLRPFAQLVIESAKAYGAQIENRSFFAMSGAELKRGEIVEPR